MDKIRDVIGSGGKVVRGIQDETGAQIDIQEDGTIHIAAIEGPAGEAAKAMILGIVKEPEVGEEYEGEVVGIKDFGAFVKLTAAKDGLLHISRVANGRVGKVEDVLSLGDVVKVKVLEVDPNTGKISLDRLDKPDGARGLGALPRALRPPAARGPFRPGTTVRVAAAARAAAWAGARRAAVTRVRDATEGPRERPLALKAWQERGVTGGRG